MPTRLGMATVAVVLALFPGAAAADVVHYKDGRTLEGEILERTAQAVKVKTAFGTITVELSKIDHIETKLTPAQELAARRSATRDDDAAALFALADWAGEHGLRTERTALLREVIAADPQHPGANEALGRVLVEGTWLDPADVEAHLAKLAEEKRAQGLVQYEGEWIPEDEAMRRRGFVLHDGEWKPQREVLTLEAIEDLVRVSSEAGQAWEPLVLEGDSVTVFSSASESATEGVVHEMDAMLRDVRKRLQLTDDEFAKIVDGFVPIYLPPSVETAQALMDGGFFDRYPHTPGNEEAFRGVTNFGLYVPKAFLMVVEDENLDLFNERDLARTGYLAHLMGELVVERLCGQRPAPPWLKIGLVAYYEGLVNYHSTLALTWAHYDANGNSVGLWQRGWENFGEWRDQLRKPEVLKGVAPLGKLMEQQAERFDSADAGVAWSVVRFLVERHPRELIDYLRSYVSKDAPRTKNLRTLQEYAWPLAFTEPVESIDLEWRAWAQEQPLRFPVNEIER